MHVTILLFDGVTALDAVGVYDPLARLPETDLWFASEGGAPCRTGDGFLTLTARAAIEDIGSTDLLLVPGGNAAGLARWVREPHLRHEIARLDATSTITASVCTGSLILGGAGLLKNRQATTNWRARSAMANFGATYSAKRIVRDGKYWTAAGVTAGIDLGLALCGQIAGSEIGSAVELAVEYCPEPPFGTGNYQSARMELVNLVETALRQTQ